MNLNPCKENPMLPIGTRVKWTRYKYRDLEQALGYGGPHHDLRVKWLAQAKAERGTVVAHCPNEFTKHALTVEWDHAPGRQMEVMDYLVEPDGRTEPIHA